jgi:hypothetical protein
MAAGLLAGEPHTYRHDLESFFYVLIWICTFYTGIPAQHRDPKPTETIFDECNEKLFDNLRTVAKVKLGYVHAQKGFQVEVLALMDKSLRENVGPVLERWRELLFPVGYYFDVPVDGLVDNTWSQAEADGLYDTMLEAVEKRIEELNGS